MLIYKYYLDYSYIGGGSHLTVLLNVNSKVYCSVIFVIVKICDAYFRPVPVSVQKELQNKDTCIKLFVYFTPSVLEKSENVSEMMISEIKAL